MLYTYKSNVLKESFDFNEVLNNADNVIEDVAKHVQLMNVINTIKFNILNKNSTIESILTYSLENSSILIDYICKLSDMLTNKFHITTKITIVNQRIIFDICEWDYYFNYEDNIFYRDIINNINNQILTELSQVFSIQKQDIEVGIVLPPITGEIWYKKSDLNNLPILNIDSDVIKNIIMPIIKLGYNNINIKKNNYNQKRLNLNNSFLKPLKYSNIFIDVKYSLKTNIIDKDIKDFIKYAKKYLIPANGHILFLSGEFNNNIKEYKTYWKNLTFCKFSDTETKMKIKNTSIQITQTDIELVYNILKKAKNRNEDIMNGVLRNIKENNINSFYARITLACILGLELDHLSTFKQSFAWQTKAEKFPYDPALVKVYFNYIIDDINNHGVIYNKLITLLN